MRLDRGPTFTQHAIWTKKRLRIFVGRWVEWAEGWVFWVLGWRWGGLGAGVLGGWEGGDL